MAFFVSKVAKLIIKSTFHKDIKLTIRYFIAPRNISIITKIDRILDSDFIVDTNVDYNNENYSMPDTVYQNLIRSFPNSRELSKYSSYRIDQIIGDYFDMIDDFKFNF